MATPKGEKGIGSASNRLIRKPLCKLMLACDGNTLTGARRDKGYCGKCEEALAKRNKPPPPLRGANTALSEADRKVDAAKEATLPDTWLHYNPMGDD